MEKKAKTGQINRTAEKSKEDQSYDGNLANNDKKCLSMEQRKKISANSMQNC